ncbi:transmembrane protein 41B isoform X2 [Cimex lectularius]|nr:transmembrane protein 41B isoform X2 [Cimex lectularius]XP_014260506.1 transmembrane protein 41B isoform X2 [Cimex lectularius]XP_014260507.1 transmembrane protein 41B isoform X2 [Cimex lectularius]
MPVHHNDVGTKTAIISICVIFAVSISALVYIYFSFPKLDEEEKRYIKIPYDIEDAKKLGRVLDRYKDRYYFEVLIAVFVTYIFLQTFAIPGSISLSILAGFLFPFPLAIILVCFCSATGASLCYLISFFAGRRLIYKYFPEKADKYSAMVEKHKDHIFNYMIFLRVTPFLPNWFINIAAPVINVPLLPFWLGTFLGVAPPSFVAIQAGKTLNQLSSTSSSFSWTTVLLLAVFAGLSLVPVFLKNRLKKKFD